MKRYRTPRHRATFVLYFQSRADARLGEVYDTVQGVLRDYQQSCRHLGDSYPFSFELSAHTQRYASLFEAVVLDAMKRARENYYPFVIAWYAVQYRKSENRYLLTFALRDADLRELVGSPP